MSEPVSPNIEPSPIGRQRCGRTAGILALAIVIFICGGGAGFGIAILVRRPPPMGMRMGPQPPIDAMVRQLQDELLLSDDQAKQIQQIYQNRETALQSIRQTMEPQLKAQYDKLNEQVKKVLNPAQYRRWSERFENVRDRMLPPPPRHGPPRDRMGDGPDRDGPNGGPNGAGPNGGRPDRDGPNGAGPNGNGPQHDNRPGPDGGPGGPGNMPPQ
jgi:hypothetical protein